MVTHKICIFFILYLVAQLQVITPCNSERTKIGEPSSVGPRVNTGLLKEPLDNPAEREWNDDLIITTTTDHPISDKRTDDETGSKFATSDRPRKEMRTRPNPIDDQFTSSERAVSQGVMKEIGEKSCIKCWDQSNGLRCIEPDERCDGRRQCPEGSDEVNCNYMNLEKLSVQQQKQQGQRRQKRSAPFQFLAVNGSKECRISRHFLPQVVTVINGLVQEYLGDEVNKIVSTSTSQEIRSAANQWSRCQNEDIIQKILNATSLLATNFNLIRQKNSRLSNFTMRADVERREIETELDRLRKEYAQVEKIVANRYEPIRSQLQRKEVQLKIDRKVAKSYLDNLETVLAMMYQERGDHPCTNDKSDNDDNDYDDMSLSRPLVPCPVTTSVLTQIKRELEALMWSAYFTMEDSCAQLKNGILHSLSVLQSFVKVRVDEKKLSQESEERLVQIGNLKLQLQRTRMEVDDLRLQSVQQPVVNISAIQATVTELQEFLDWTRTEITETKERGQEDWTQFIISLVSCGDHLMAKLQFIQMTAPASFLVNDDNGTILSRIVTQSYDKKIENVGLILNFLLVLPLTSQRIIGLTQLVHEIEKNGGIHPPQVLELVTHIEDNMADYRSTSEGLQNLTRSLRSARTRILNGWAGAILSGNLNGSVLQFMKNEPYRVTENLVSDLFDHVYLQKENDDMGKVERVIKFADELNPPALHYTHETLLHLFSRMMTRGEVRSCELIILGDWLKKMEWSNLNQTQLKIVQRALPRGVQALVDGAVVAIESRQYEHNYTLYGGNYGNIFTYPHNNYEDDGQKQRWRPLRDKTGRYFIFRSGRSRKILYSPSDGDVHSRSPLDGSLEQEWEVTPIEGGTFFTFKNHGNNRYLNVNVLRDCWDSRRCCCSTVITTVGLINSKYLQWNIYKV